MRSGRRLGLELIHMILQPHLVGAKLHHISIQEIEFPLEVVHSPIETR